MQKQRPRLQKFFKKMKNLLFTAQPGHLESRDGLRLPLVVQHQQLELDLGIGVQQVTRQRRP